MTGNTEGTELRLFARRIGLLDTGDKRLPTAAPTTIGVLRPFTGMLDAPVHRPAGPPVDLSYLTLAPVVRRALADRGGGDAGPTTGDADERDRDDSTDPGTELTVRELLREQDSSDADVTARERRDSDDDPDAPTAPAGTLPPTTTVDTAWSDRRSPGLDRPTVSGPRRTVLDVPQPGPDGPDGTDQGSGGPRSGGPDRRADQSTPSRTAPMDPTLAHRSTAAGPDRDRIAAPDPSGSAVADADAPSGPPDVGDVDAPRLTLPQGPDTSRTASGADGIGPTPDPADIGGVQEPAGPTVGAGDDAGASGGDGVGSTGDGAGPALTVRRPPDPGGARDDPVDGAGSTARANRTGSAGAADMQARGDRQDDSATLAALLENGDADRVVDELYRAVSRRMAIERDRRGG